MRRPRLTHSGRIAHDVLLETQQFKCYYCGHDIARARQANKVTGVRASTIDHVIPLYIGGPNTMKNFVAACSPCNVKKGHKTIEEFTKERLK